MELAASADEFCTQIWKLFYCISAIINFCQPVTWVEIYCLDTADVFENVKSMSIV